MNVVLVILFSAATFLASALMFAAEPMVGKMVLPIFGGTPAVWNTCLVYFQMILLGGYAGFGGGLIPSGAERKLASPGYLLILAGLLAIGIASPMAPDPGPSAGYEHPAAGLLRTLLGAFTVPLLMVAMAAPLVQHWFRLTRHPRADDPYFLYAASNAGSLLALLAYPLAIEPNLSLREQARFWRAGLLVEAILLAACAVVVLHERGRRPDSSEGTSTGGWPSLGGCLILALVPSSWLMGVTSYLTTDLAPMPMLWVVPLALYLLSFIVAFAGPDSRFVRLASGSIPMLVLPLALVLGAGFVHAAWIPLHLLAFFAGAVACHGALARRRPHARDLGPYYVAIAFGGLLGGVFNAIIAPVIFDRIVEYPMAIVVGSLLGLGMAIPSSRRGWTDELILPAFVFAIAAMLVTNLGGLADSAVGGLALALASGLGVLAMVKARRRPLRFAMVVAAILAATGLSQGKAGRLLHIERDFFGVVRVTEDESGMFRRLFHGSTLHGQERIGLDKGVTADEPLTYFTRSGPIGDLFRAIGPRPKKAGGRVGVVGLGAGTLAAYAAPGQRWTFYEIDPAIVRIAGDPQYFTYLENCRAEAVDVVVGDARLRLREAPDRAYDLLILDAFSSDALPVHLVTREAIALYRSKLAEGGVLAFNLSNRYLDLEPLIGRQALDAGLVCRVRADLDVTPEERDGGKQPSIWAVIAADLGGLADKSGWHEPRVRADSSAWTDERSDLRRYIRWRPIVR